MLFKTEDFYADLVDEKDIYEVAGVYNSNKHFLVCHIGKEKITSEWIFKELEIMKKAGFSSCKIVKSGKIIGAIDFKVKEETYLSLLIIHNNFKGKGFGKLIFQAFEEFVKSKNSKSIRIDVVSDYNNSVLDFWRKNGFTEFKKVKLNWSGKSLSAAALKKSI